MSNIENRKVMTQDEYDEMFDVGNPKTVKLQEAFKQVSDIRKFEIELYWKRATYFWALIAVAFTGYFAILSSEHMQNKFFLSMVVAAIGFIFTFAWFLVNRGSKYWQENWEYHLDLLENNVTGPLYKTQLERASLDTVIEKYITGPLRCSVSKINQWVNVFVLLVWVGLSFFSMYKSLGSLRISIGQWFILAVHMLVLIVALVCGCLMFSKGKGNKDENTLIAKCRTTGIQKNIDG